MYYFFSIEVLDGSVPSEYKESLAKTLASCFGDVGIGVYLPSTVYMVLDEKRVIATVFITPRHSEFGPTSYYLYNVCTHQDYQRRGIMGGLLRMALEDVSKSSRVSLPLSVYLEVDPGNISAYHLYQKVGFQRIGSTQDGRYDLLQLSLE